MKYRITITFDSAEPEPDYVLNAWQQFFSKGAAGIPDVDNVQVAVTEVGDE